MLTRHHRLTGKGDYRWVKPILRLVVLALLATSSHVQARGAELTLAYPDSATGTVSLLANPLKMSETPVTYRHAPPKLDEHREDVLADWLGRTNPSNSE